MFLEIFSSFITQGWKSCKPIWFCCVFSMAVQVARCDCLLAHTTLAFDIWFSLLYISTSLKKIWHPIATHCQIFIHTIIHADDDVHCQYWFYRHNPSISYWPSCMRAVYLICLVWFCFSLYPDSWGIVCLWLLCWCRRFQSHATMKTRGKWGKNWCCGCAVFYLKSLHWCVYNLRRRREKKKRIFESRK